MLLGKKVNPALKLFLVALAVVDDLGAVIVVATVYTNEIHADIEECPRKDLPTGVGYDLCKKVCKQKHHAEVDACLKAGKEAQGGTLFLIGHTYCCDACKKVMDEHGIKKAIICSDTD